ncbi:MAG TPA: hypothetical protein PLO67_04400 [Saprospiraceae bacterium]|nr:hypothetical protein [Saprospiraceae bacterium]HPI04869.1 hypothetical protein [Saprospiraceae bacterium]
MAYKKTSETKFHPSNLTQVILDWNKDFDPLERLTETQRDAVVQRFTVQANRQLVLTNSLYVEDQVWAVLYGKMLKEILGGGSNFTQQGEIVALVLVWVIGTNNKLELKPVALDKLANPTPKFPKAGKLYDALKSNVTFTVDPIKSDVLTRALGFSTPPVQNRDVYFVPAIVNREASVPYFALTTSIGVSTQQFVYAPPCPPFCY